MHRTVTGSHMELSEMENLISGASTRGQETETSSIASSSQTGRSNIIQVGRSPDWEQTPGLHEISVLCTRKFIQSVEELGVQKND